MEMGVLVVYWDMLSGRAPVRKGRQQDGQREKLACDVAAMMASPIPGARGWHSEMPQREARGLGLCVPCINQSLHMNCSGEGGGKP